MATVRIAPRSNAFYNNPRKMRIQIVLATAMTVATVIFHVAGLVALARGLEAGAPRLHVLPRTLRSVTLMVASVLTVLMLHTVEAGSWATLLLYLGEFDSMESALYFSTVTATTLGYGDLTLSTDWRLLGAFEAMAGLILFAASTAFLLELTRQILDD